MRILPFLAPWAVAVDRLWYGMGMGKGSSYPRVGGEYTMGNGDLGLIARLIPNNSDDDESP